MPWEDGSFLFRFVLVFQQVQSALHSNEAVLQQSRLRVCSQWLCNWHRIHSSACEQHCFMWIQQGELETRIHSQPSAWSRWCDTCLILGGVIESPRKGASDKEQNHHNQRGHCTGSSHGAICHHPKSIHSPYATRTLWSKLSFVNRLTSMRCLQLSIKRYGGINAAHISEHLPHHAHNNPLVHYCTLIMQPRWCIAPSWNIELCDYIMCLKMCVMCGGGSNAVWGCCCKQRSIRCLDVHACIHIKITYAVAVHLRR